MTTSLDSLCYSQRCTDDQGFLEYCRQVCWRCSQSCADHRRFPTVVSPNLLAWSSILGTCTMSKASRSGCTSVYCSLAVLNARTFSADSKTLNILARSRRIWSMFTVSFRCGGCSTLHWPCCLFLRCLYWRILVLSRCGAPQRIKPEFGHIIRES